MKLTITSLIAVAAALIIGRHNLHALFPHLHQ